METPPVNVRVGEQGPDRSGPSETLCDTILIVDDEVTIRTILDRIARTIPGVETRLASSPEDALDVIKAVPVALVITDLNMPGQTGGWLLNQIRRMKLAIPVVILSALVDAITEKRLLRLGALQVLRKPVAAMALREMLVEWLKKPVTFVLVARPGDVVTVAGSFNNWNPQQYKLHEELTPGFFSITLPLSRGRHEYKFVVNGAWTADPRCSTPVANGLGSYNSLLQV